MADFVKVCTVDEIKQGKARRFNVNGTEVALFNVNGIFYAIGAT